MNFKNPSLSEGLPGLNGHWLCLDPGNCHTGWVVVGPDESVVGHLNLIGHGDAPNLELRRQIFSLREDHRRSTLLIETPRPRGQRTSAEEMETLIEIGRFLQMWRGPWSYVFRLDVKMTLLGVPKGNDADVRQALLDRFGGVDRAVGGKKCGKCKGKKWVGRDHRDCSECFASGWSVPPGPLVNVKRHEWSALGLACFWADSDKNRVHAVAGKQPVKRKKVSKT